MKLIFRGRRTFNIETTIFRFKEDLYKPISQSFLVSRSDVPYSIVSCHKIDDVLELDEQKDLEDAEPAPDP